MSRYKSAKVTILDKGLQVSLELERETKGNDQMKFRLIITLGDHRADFFLDNDDLKGLEDLLETIDHD